MQNILKVENLTKKYGDKIACENISFDVVRGEFLAIVGESGSGKSTLVKMFANLENKNSGSVFFDDEDITNLSGKKLRESRKNMQLVFQDTTESLNPKMKIKDIVTEPLLNFKLISKNDITKKALEYLEKVGLDESFLNKYPRQMSGGQRQRVNIARAITLEPKILLLDEPTSALDVVTQSKILELLADLQRQNNLTIVFICHDIALVTSISDRIIVMKDANVVEILKTKEIKSSELSNYTKELLNATFDTKKCECKFSDECKH